jgi:hypothetical protein
MQDRRTQPSYSQLTTQRSVILTTSRSASPRTRSLVSTLRLITPVRKLSRGKKNVPQLVEIARAQNAQVLIVTEKFGNPAGFVDLASGTLYAFDGVFIARGVRKLVGRSLPAKVIPPERQPTSAGAKALVHLLSSFPSHPGSFNTKLEAVLKDDREVLGLEARGTSCVAFFFRLEGKENSSKA